MALLHPILAEEAGNRLAEDHRTDQKRQEGEEGQERNRELDSAF